MLFLLVRFIVLFLMCAALETDHKTIKLDRFDMCVNPKSSSLQFYNVRLRTVANHVSLIDSEMNISRDIKKLSIILKITRCSHRELLDSCMNFGTIRLRDSCFILAQKHGLYSTYSYSFTPPLVCPLKKGHYIQINGTFDPKLFDLFDLGKWYWKIKTEIYDYYTKEFLVTNCLEGQVVSGRA